MWQAEGEGNNGGRTEGKEMAVSETGGDMRGLQRVRRLKKKRSREDEELVIAT